VTEVGLDRLLRDEQRLGDVAVHQLAGGELDDPQLARREGVAPLERRPARPAAGGEQLLAGALAEPSGVAASGELGSAAQRRAGAVGSRARRNVAP
jgi:hypothetical protein